MSCVLCSMIVLMLLSAIAMNCTSSQLDQRLLYSCQYPKTSCELNCTSKGFSCNFLDLTVRQSPQGLSCDIFDKRSQPEYAAETQFVGWYLSPAFTHCRELIKSVGKL
jgi:hypothetical protein